MKLNYFKFTLAIIFLLQLSIFSFAQELKLRCNVKVKVVDTFGKIENSAAVVFLEVSDYGVNKYIFATSSNLDINDITVTSNPKEMPGKRKEISDYSDINKWDVINTVTDQNKNSVSVNRIIIDRNLGEIILQRRFTVNNNSIETSANGNCEKIDQQKKKF